MRVKLIEAENVSKKGKDGKREVSILDGVSFSVYKGGDAGHYGEERQESPYRKQEREFSAYRGCGVGWGRYAGWPWRSSCTLPRLQAWRRQDMLLFTTF